MNCLKTKAAGADSKFPAVFKEYAAITSAVVTIGAVLIGGCIWLGSLHSLTLRNVEILSELKAETKETQRAIQGLQIEVNGVQVDIKAVHDNVRSLDGKFDQLLTRLMR